DETAGRGTLEFLRPLDTVSIALHPDGDHLAVQRFSGEVEVYDLRTGNLDLSIALAPFHNSSLLSYNAAGDVLVVGWQRFDAETGELLNRDARYHPGFDAFFFSADSQTLITRNGLTFSDW